MENSNLLTPEETSEDNMPEQNQPELEQPSEINDIDSPETQQAEELQPIEQPIITQPTQFYLQRMVVNIENGEKLGSVSDLLFNPYELEVAALITSTGGLLQRETLAIPAHQVRVWGKDFILIEGGGDSLENISPDHENWLSLINNIKGKQVISSDGVRLGQIEDVNINSAGKIIDFRLSQIFVKGPLYESMRIPIAVTRALGRDALIIDIEKVSEN